MNHKGQPVAFKASPCTNEQRKTLPAKQNSQSLLSWEQEIEPKAQFLDITVRAAHFISVQLYIFPVVHILGASTDIVLTLVCCKMVSLKVYALQWQCLCLLQGIYSNQDQQTSLDNMRQVNHPTSSSTTTNCHLLLLLLPWCLCFAALAWRVGSVGSQLTHPESFYDQLLSPELEFGWTLLLKKNPSRYKKATT